MLELPQRKTEAVQKLLSLGEDAAPDLGMALDDPRPEMVMTFAHLLRLLGPKAKAAQPYLERLANGEDKQLSQAARWAMATVRGHGHILVAAGGNAAVVVLDMDGKEKSRLANQSSVFDAEPLPNGNCLICRYSNRLVQEITPKGKVAWQYTKARTPMDADRLPNGNTLISDIAGRVFEIDSKGKVVWETKAANCYNATRLPNGNTLIPEYAGNQVREVDPKGKVVWKVKARNPMDCLRLPDGNSWIVEYTGNLRLVNPKGKTLKTIAVPNAYSVAMLPNGDLLVAANGGVYRFDETGKQVWHTTLRMVGSVELH